MAEYETIRPNVTGVRTAEIDQGLRAHMNKIYGTMSVGLLVTAAAAWGVGTTPALVEAIFATPLKWLVMFAPLILVFAFGAMINTMSCRPSGAQTWRSTPSAAVMGLVDRVDIFAVFTGMGSIFQTFLIDRRGVPAGLSDLRLHDAAGSVGLGLAS